MCGFGGVINHNQPLHLPEVGRIASKVSFRGPDNCGVRILDNNLNRAESGNTALFFNRLAIIDLDSRSDQPFEDEHHLLMFNGEIYNYKELRTSLEKEGFTFHTTSDTEVLFVALRLWGKKALEKLNGMFAFFWLDKKARTFITGRDRLGIKPLYYHYGNNGFYFSSEADTIVRLLNKKPTISKDSIDMYLWMQFIPTPHSIYEDILKLPPGSVIEAAVDHLNKKPAPHIYWDAYQETLAPYENNNENLEEILRTSIARQLQSDVPLGLFLSSGVDSSLLGAMVNKYFATGNDVNFFTVSFNEQTQTDESKDAAAFINGFKNPHLKNHLLEVDAGYLQNHISELYNYYDEPFGDYASLLNWVISRKAREHVTVAISGDGADELFWGYSRYNKWQELQRLNSIPLLSRAIFKGADWLPLMAKNKLKKAFRHDAVERNFDLFLMPAFREHFKSSITSNTLWALDGIDLVKNRKDLPAIVDIKTYLADGMLYKVDRSSMATSLEVRVPYLDNKVLNFALHLELSKKSNAQYKNKAILKELLLKLAPHYDVNRPKKGFSFPLKKWLKESWKEQVNELVNSRNLLELGLDPKEFLPIINNFYEKDTNSEVEVWYLFNLALWKKHFDEIKN
ncbi:MAG: asparagine synthase (glutamine-hydrolyzing) [Flavitalea sp.]